MPSAFRGQTRIDSAHIFGEERFKTPGPSFDDTMLLELCDQNFGLAILQRTKWPVEQIHVGVDDSKRPDGRGSASRRLGRRGLTAEERNSGRAQQRAF